MTTRNLTVLSELPRFSGYNRDDETPFHTELDARTFLRAIDTYCEINNITDDKTKIQILFSQIDKKRGNAIQLVTVYAGGNRTFEQVKKGFLDFYPQLKVTERRDSCRNLLKTNLEKADLFGPLTALEVSAKAVAEAYLQDNEMTLGKIGEEAVVYPKPVVSGTSPAAQPTEGTQHTAVTPPDPPISLLEVLKNYTMHIFIDAQAPKKVFEKTRKIGPDKPSEELMSETMKANVKYKAERSETKKPPRENEFVWETTQGKPPPQRNQWRGSEVHKRQMPEKKGSYDLSCHRCGLKGHFAKSCRNCAFCKSPDHTTKSCEKRIAQAKGKYCSHCKLPDSHDTNECLKLKALKRRKGNVQLTQEVEGGTYSPSTYDSNVIEASDDSEDY